MDDSGELHAATWYACERHAHELLISLVYIKVFGCFLKNPLVRFDK